MTVIGVQCPNCLRLFCVNGRGACRCGAYLIHHFAGNSCWIRDPEQTWICGGDPTRREDWTPFHALPPRRPWSA